MEEYGEQEEEITSSPVPSSATEHELPANGGKPEIWVRLRPLPGSESSLFDVSSDGKGLRMIPNYEDQFDARGNLKSSHRLKREQQSGVFQCDGVLRNTSQEDTYQMIAHDLVGKAMDGISGIIASVGPELSGKYFTLFGSINKFQYRGIIPRCLERIFQICAAKSNEMRYLIRMAIVEIRYDKIRDLLTLGSYEGNPFNRDSPHGMIFQKIGAAEHGFGLLIRALTCQKEIPREPYAKPHTVVFIDIYGESYKNGMPEPNPRIVKSRITFAKTAAVPERDEIFSPGRAQSSPVDMYGCVPPRPSPANKGAAASRASPSSTDCSKSGCITCAKKKTGPIAEAIRIRQDIGFLEQMCSRACQYQKLNRYYERLAKLGINIASPQRSHHYRLSKLTYCLKDIASGNSEIRIILHIRPERRYKHATLEAMRFAEKIKCVPYGMDPSPQKDQRLSQCSSEDQGRNMSFRDGLTLEDFLSKIPPEISDLYVQVQPGTFKAVRDHALALFDNRLQPLDELGPANLGELFEKFKFLWTYVAETGVVPVSLAPNTGSQQFDTSGITPTGSDEAGRKSKRSSTMNVLGQQDRKSSGSNNNGDTTPLSTKNKGSTGSGAGAAVADDQGSGSASGGKIKYSKSRTSSIKDKKDKGKKKKEKNSKGGMSDSSTRGSAAELDGNGKVDEAEMPGIPPLSAEDTAHEGLEEETNESSEKPEALDELLGSTEGTTGALESGDAPTKEETWREFLQTPKGLELYEDLSRKSKALREIVVDQSDTTKQTSYVFSRLNNLQKELNLIQQERFVKGDEYDAKGNIIIAPREKQIIQDIKILEQTRNELASKLNSIREQIHSHKSEVDLAKLDTDIAFQTFALDHYAVAYDGSLKPEEMNDKTVEQEQEEERERIKKFEDIKRVAKKQARLFLRAIAKKPSWVPY